MEYTPTSSGGFKKGTGEGADVYSPDRGIAAILSQKKRKGSCWGPMEKGEKRE